MTRSSNDDKEIRCQNEDNGIGCQVMTRRCMQTTASGLGENNHQKQKLIKSFQKKEMSDKDYTKDNPIIPKDGDGMCHGNSIDSDISDAMTNIPYMYDVLYARVVYTTTK